MNIGIDIRPLLSPIRTGVGEYTYELLNTIFQIDRQNQYFLFYNSYKDLEKYLPTWKYENVYFIKKNWPNKLFNFCQKFIKWPKIDTFTPQKLDYFFSPNLNFTALSKKTKHILTVHDLSFELFPEYFSFKQKLWHYLVSPKKQCHCADIILTPSANTKRDLINFYKLPENKIKIIYPGLSSVFNEPQKQTKNLQLPDNYILFLGALEPRKNVLGVISAFEQIFNYLPLPYSLVIAGAPGWKNKDIFEKIEKSPLKQKITFIGYVKNEDKPELYRRAAVFVYPSFYEGFGFPVLEAMQSGLPVITSNRSSLPEIVNDSAWLTEPNKPAQIAEGLSEILNNPTIKEVLIQKSIKQATHFTWNKAAREFLEILK
jgi:glycosyltransferase involved in cell wall biosynthesis